MCRIPNPFQPKQNSPSKNPYINGQPIPNMYIQQQHNRLPPAAFSISTNTAVKTPYESSIEFQNRTGLRMIDLGIRNPNNHNVSTKKIADNKVRFVGEKFLEVANKLFLCENDRQIPLANFIIQVTHRVSLKSIDKSTVFLTVKIIGTVSEIELSVPLSKYQSLLTEVKNNYPEFRLNAEFRSAYPFFQEYCSLIYEESLATINNSIIYQYAGWEKIDDHMVYLSGRLPYCQSERYVHEINPHNIPLIYQEGLQFLAIGSSLKTILPIFLYAHIGYTAQLFEDAGYEIQFLLMVVGKTGSFKTSLCKEIFQAFNTDKFLNFQSTPRAIELQRNECRDMTLLLDDIFSSKDKEVSKKFEDILRVCGDSASRATADATSTKTKRFDVRGGIVVTGESDLNTQQSSRLRYLTVSVDNSSFNSEKLRYYQSNRAEAKQYNQPSIIQNYFSAYIYFLEKNYHSVVQEIMHIDDALTPLNVKFPRLNMIYRVMVAISRIIIRFGLHYGALTEEAALTLLNQWIETICYVILENQNDSSICEPHIAYLDALFQGIATGDIILAKNKELYFQSSRDYVGFYDQLNDKLYLIPQKAYKFIEKYYSELKGSFEASPLDIHKALYENGLSEGYQEKDRNRYLKKISHGNQKIQLLCLKRNAIEKLLSEEKN